MKTKSKIMARAAKKEGIPVEKLHMPKVESKDLKGLPFVPTAEEVTGAFVKAAAEYVVGCRNLEVNSVRVSYRTESTRKVLVVTNPEPQFSLAPAGGEPVVVLVSDTQWQEALREAFYALAKQERLLARHEVMHAAVLAARKPKT